MHSKLSNTAAANRKSRFATLLIVSLLLYVLSSGPVLAIAFWLREATGWDGFYYMIWAYWPLLAMGHGNPIVVYIEWWVNAFGTVGPG